MSNSLDLEQARHVVGPDLGPNSLLRLSSADDTVRWNKSQWRRIYSIVKIENCSFSGLIMEQLSISGEILWQCNGIVSQVRNSNLSRVHRLDAPNKHAAQSELVCKKSNKLEMTSKMLPRMTDQLQNLQSDLLLKKSYELTGVTVLGPWARHFIRFKLALVQPRKTGNCPDMTEK